MAKTIFQKILLVDDEEMVRFTVQEFLERLGYLCHVASDGREALDLLEREVCDLVISDIVMPEMDGIQFMKEAKKSLPRLDFIIMTGHASDYSYIDIIDSGAADYMTKPFEMKELKARLARIEREKAILMELHEKNVQLNETKEYIENIISSMADSLIVLKPDLTIGMANRATCELLGYTEQELLGEPLSKILFEGESFGEKVIQELIQKGYLKDSEMFYKDRSGEKVLISFLGSAMYREVRGKETLVGIICVAHDMRAIKELQNQVFHADKMASIGVLAAGVAHEIKNPLAIILQGMEYVTSALSLNPENAPLQEPVERIKDAALRADKIVKGLLDYSRQSSVNLEELDAVSIVEETIMLVGHQFNLHRIKIIRQFLPDLPKVTADGSQIKQVFINILVNAVEAMPDGGTITIGTRLDEPGNLLISFADSGQGIPKDALQKVFEPFYSTKTKTGSTGLGLSVSQGIIEKLGGTMNIESEENKGTTVTVSLPYG